MCKEKEIEKMAEVIALMDERNAHYYDKHMQVCEAFADAENIAEALYNAGYRKESDVAEEIFAELLKISTADGAYDYVDSWDIAELRKKYRGKEEKKNDTQK